MAQSIILGPNGLPIDTESLTAELGHGGVSGIRQVWRDSVARNLTPSRLVVLVEQAARGEADEYLELAQEMEERELHYLCVLSTRKRAVTRLPVMVEAASDDPDDIKIADDVRELTRKPGFRALRKNMMDALGKGYSAHVIHWERGQKWMPSYEWYEPRWFRYDRVTGRELRLKDEADPFNGVPLLPYKWIVHQPQLKTGLQIRSGLARLVAFAWICKQYAQKDWNAFAEVFGLPLRIGRYGPTATRQDVAILRQAVSSLGSDAAAILPQSMSIDFVNSAKNGGGDLFEKLCDYLDRQISKAVLGQTMTADAQSSGMGSNNANVHNEVREDIRDDDAQDAEETLNRDLVIPYVTLNYGPRERYPQIKFPIRKTEDAASLVKNVTALVPFGLRIEESEMRDRLGFPEPAENAVLLQAPKQAVASPFNPPINSALNAASKPESNTPDQQSHTLASTADPVVQAMLEPVYKLLEKSSSFEEFRDQLLDLYDDLDANTLADVMGEALAAAHAAGRYELMISV